jgi:hypothetical protein
MSFSMHRGTLPQGQTQSPRNRPEKWYHHYSKASNKIEAHCPTITTTTTTTTPSCQRWNKKQLVRFGLLAMSLLIHHRLDVNDISSTRRRSFYYCHAFQPDSISSSSFHARKRKPSSKWGHQLRPTTITSLAMSRSSVEEENMDEGFLSDGSFVEQTFQERYGSSSSSSSQPPVLPDWLIQKCNDCGWTHPTRIQQRALDVICVDKRDAIIQAETGSGKRIRQVVDCRREAYI